MRSLRAQLTLAYLAFFTLLFAAFTAFLYGELSRSLTARLDETLASEADTAAVLFPDELHEMQGDSVAAAREVVSELKLRGDAVVIREGDRVLAGSAHTTAGARERRAARRVESGGHTFEIVVSSGAEAIGAELAVVRRVIFVTLPLILALAGLGGYWLASRGLRPLGLMAEQAQRITGSNLDTRIEVAHATEEVGVLVASFNELLARLDRSFETMRRFSADASHELRTPMAVIRGEADVALSRERGPAEYRESLGIILDESRRVSRLIDDLLNLARADAGHVALQARSFYLNELLAECCRSVQAAASAGGVTVECHAGGDLQFTGDEQLLRRLTINLLENAVRYTPAGGKVSAALERQGSEVRLVVADTGVGIAREDAARVFERFYRAGEARSRKDGGFGLGLAIVRWIAESHKGTVECASEVGRGSTFTVTLPG
ncbi:MAG: ATP-binding protein [Candidatus Solibacter sp.]